MRVLVVEDSNVSLKLMSSILTKHAYEVETASTGKEAVSVLESQAHIDIIITDIMMPVMDGFHLLAYLKTEPKYSWIPVILCSAMNDLANVKKAISLGATDFITKPVEAKTLIAKIKKAKEKIPKAVLLVDDEKLLLDLLRNILERTGLRVLTAENGQDALQLLEANKISVVLSDVVMPQMDGLELTTRIKKHSPSLPVLLVTGHSDKYHQQKLLDAGADGCITKPFKNSEILQRIAPFVS